MGQVYFRGGGSLGSSAVDTWETEEEAGKELSEPFAGLRTWPLFLRETSLTRMEEAGRNIA